MHILIALGTLTVALICLCGLGMGILLTAVGFLLHGPWKNAVRALGIGISAVSILSALLIGACAAWMWRPNTKLADVFQFAFNAPIPATVTNVSGKIGGFGDAAGSEMRFTTDEETFLSLVPIYLKPIPYATWERKGTLTLPSWWTAPRGERVKIYYYDNWFSAPRTAGPHGCTSETAVITWDPATGMVQFVWEGSF
jgi:hypothetical protein